MCTREVFMVYYVKKNKKLYVSKSYFLLVFPFIQITQFIRYTFPI